MSIFVSFFDVCLSNLFLVLPMAKWDRVCLVQNVEAKLCLQNVSRSMLKGLLCLPSSWGSALVMSSGGGCRVLWVLCSGCDVRPGAARFSAAPQLLLFIQRPLCQQLVKPSHWFCQCRLYTELQSTRSGFPDIINLS